MDTGKIYLSEKEKKAYAEHWQGSTYEEMLRHWRFAPVGCDDFTGEKATLFKQIMDGKKQLLCPYDQVQISKSVGWVK